MKKRVLKHRFSLIELLVVCGLLMVLMGIGVGVYSLVQRKMNDSRCKAMIAKMSIALENYKSKTGYYIQAVTLTAFYVDDYLANEVDLNDFIDIPTSEIGGKTAAPWSRGAWKDPFGNEFRYQCPGIHNPMSFDLYSSGSDKSSTMTEDDISNWKQ
jgi:Tfp pilus assembly protein PilE